MYLYSASPDSSSPFFSASLNSLTFLESTCHHYVLCDVCPLNVNDSLLWMSKLFLHKLDNSMLLPSCGHQQQEWLGLMKKSRTCHKLCTQMNSDVHICSSEHSVFNAAKCHNFTSSKKIFLDFCVSSSVNFKFVQMEKSPSTEVTLELVISFRM